MNNPKTKLTQSIINKIATNLLRQLIPDSEPVNRKTEIGQTIRTLVTFSINMGNHKVHTTSDFEAILQSAA
jgi:hypothetical protein